MPNPHARLTALLDAYLGADYQWQCDGHWYPLAIGECAPEMDRIFPDARQFGLLSAWNPYSVARPDETNRVSDEALHAALLSSGQPLQPGFSSARNRSWREPSWVVVDMPLPEFDALSRRFGQLGTLWWQRGQPIRLRMDATKPSSQAGHPFSDWLK